MGSFRAAQTRSASPERACGTGAATVNGEEDAFAWEPRNLRGPHPIGLAESDNFQHAAHPHKKSAQRNGKTACT